MPARSSVLQLVTKAVSVSLSVLVIAAFSAWALLDSGSSKRASASVPAAATRTVASGYWLVASDGGVFTYGDAQFHGSPGEMHLNAPIVGMAATSDGDGYWLVASDGGVFTYGDAQFHGSPGGMHLNAPIVGMAATSDGDGYWLVASDGGVFTYGDAQFHGSPGGMHLNAPIVGMAATSDGDGYWLVASDGGVFTYGDAQFHGSTGGQHLNAPIVGMAATSDGDGYWLVASDGGVFTYGDAQFHGSTGGSHLNKPVVGMATDDTGAGYWLVSSDGGIFNYGDATFDGSTGSVRLNAPVVAAAIGGSSGGGGSGSQECTTDPNGDALPTTGAYYDPTDINNSDGYDTYVGNDEWGANPGTMQTFCATGPSNWNVEASEVPSDNTGVQAYPNVQQLYTDWGPSNSSTPLADVTDITSTFVTTDPSTGNWELAYDIWLDNTPNQEVMLWVDTSDSRRADNGSTVITPNASIHGQSWTYMNYAGALPILMLNANEASGGVDIKAALSFLQTVGAVSPGANIDQINFGWEICNTAGQTLTFAVRGYTLNRSPENAS